MTDRPTGCRAELAMRAPEHERAGGAFDRLIAIQMSPIVERHSKCKSPEPGRSQLGILLHFNYQ